MKEDFIFLPPQSGDSAVQIYLAGISYCDSSYRISRKCSDTFVFEYIVSGSGTCRNGDEFFNPQAGDVYILPEYSDHEYISSSHDPWVKLWFNAAGPLINALLDVYQLSGRYYFPDCHVEDVFRQGQQALARSPGDVQKLAPGIMLNIILAIASSCRNGTIQTFSARHQKLQHLLDEYIYRPVPSLSEISGRIKLSVPQLIRVCRQEFGMTPHHYLMQRKMEIGKILLKNTTRMVKIIAAELGFADVYYFSNAFKKYTGDNPSAFRSKYRQ